MEVELVSAVAEAPVDEEESKDAGELYYVSWARPVISITITDAERLRRWDANLLFWFHCCSAPTATLVPLIQLPPFYED